MDLKTLQTLALDVAAARSVDSVLEGMVKGLGRSPAAALVRIWLIQPGDVCDTCALRDECPTQVDCLHLVASAGQSIVSPQQPLDGIDGRFRRFPLNVRKVGRIAATGEAELLVFDRDPDWAVDPDWIRAEGVEEFAGQPLIYRGKVLGVLAVFCRDQMDEDSFGWLRTFADQAAVAIANARAFEEVQCLREQLELERDYLREEVKVAQTLAGMVGESPALRQIEKQIEMVGPTEASVLIQGESGTGKELIASAIHECSSRAGAPMIRVNCASIPRELFESEFFGHAKGSFTGAVSERAGRFQVANGGTLFLDEVGEIPLELQGKLLRVLQEGQYSRVGEDTVRTTDVRLITATNRDLKREAADGEFRLDLYYRLGVFPLDVPPLRERREDIPLLASHFLRQATSQRNTIGLILRKKDVNALLAYDWPGNVRELQNVMERAVILATADRLHFDLEPVEGRVPATQGASEGTSGPVEIETDAEFRARERRNIVAALERASWKISGDGGAAQLLQIKPTTLRSRMKAMDIFNPKSS